MATHEDAAADLSFDAAEDEMDRRDSSETIRQPGQSTSPAVPDTFAPNAAILLRPTTERLDSSNTLTSFTSLTTDGLQSSATTVVGQTPARVNVIPSGLPWMQFRIHMLTNFDRLDWNWIWIHQKDPRHIDKCLSPVLWAAAAGDVDAVIPLMSGPTKSFKQTMNRLSLQGGQEECLHVAAAFGRMEVVKLLLQKKAFVDAQDIKERTPLYIAVMREHVDIVRHLLDSGAKPNEHPKFNPTSLDRAISLGNEDIVEMLLERGASVSIFDSTGNYPLHIAAKGASPRIISMLIDHSAAVEVTQKGKHQTPLHVAASHQNLDIVRRLLERGANVNSIAGWANNTALHAAVSAKTPEDVAADLKVETVQLLLERGADVKILDKYGRTPLHCAFAASFSHDEDDATSEATVEVIKLLLNHGAEIQSPAAATGGSVPYPRSNWTPLHEAAFSGSEAVVRTLLARGASVHAQDGEGYPPLQAAIDRLFRKHTRDFFNRASIVEKRRNEVVATQVIQLLLGAGANPAKCYGWCTSARAASTVSAAEVIRTLRVNGDRFKHSKKKQQKMQMAMGSAEYVEAV